MAVFTIGEILCIVIGNVLIGEIAPEHLRGAYYGANGFALIIRTNSLIHQHILRINQEIST
jgi:hypothetical protein